MSARAAAPPTGLAAVMATLESLGTEQTRRTYRRHEVPDPMFGVKFGDLRPLAKRIGTDHMLALGLWATGNADARILATMVADPAQADDALLDGWLAACESYGLVDALVSGLAGKVPGVPARADRWIASPRDQTAQAGWDLVSQLAANDDTLPDDWFEQRLATIAERMMGYGNWTRRAASGAIINIGLRDEALEASARQTAAHLGRVTFDPGQTSCVMPDPIPYLEKVKAHRAGKSRGA